MYDFAIIGSGYGGFIPALRLAEAGFSVIVLEKGKAFADSDFRQSYSPSYFRKLYDCWYTSDYQAFFTTARILGGGSVLNAGASIKAPPEAFDALKDGKRLWPQSISRSTLDPYYEIVRKELGIHQIAWDEVSKAGGKFASILNDAGHTFERASFNYRNCVQCGFCQAGCRFGRKNTGVTTYIEKSLAFGAKYLTSADVQRIVRGRDQFEVVFRKGVREKTIHARRVILAAGTFGNVQILHNSRGFLPTLSSRIGDRFSTSGSLSFFFELASPDPEYFCYMGQTNPGIYGYDLWDEHRIVLHATTVPLAVLGAVPLRRANEDPSLLCGADFMQKVNTLFPHKIVGGAVHGLLNHSGTVRVEKGGLKIYYHSTPELERYVSTAKILLGEIAANAGVNLLVTSDKKTFDMSTTLMLGTCSMADSIEGGVVDPDGRVFNCPGLYITDSSAIPASLGVNPYFTIAANAERLSRAIIADQ